MTAVYSLKFDYNLAAVPDENGPVLMRADMDMPGYWNSIINSPPDSGTDSTRRKRDVHQPEGLERRWFGPFDDWLERLTLFDVEDSVERNFHWADTYQVFHAETQCPNFSAMLDISISGDASVTSQFGYYLEASVIPPSIQQAYVYFKAGAGASATLTVDGAAEAHFSSDRAELTSFGFPGLYYPGLLTLGPSLHLYGQLSGQLSLSGHFSGTVGYQLPSIDMSLGKQDSNHDETNVSPGVSPDSNNWGYNYSVGYNIDLSGNAQVHVVNIPSLQLGLSVLGGLVMDAQVFAELDLWAGVGIQGSVSSAAAPQFCLTPEFGADLNVGFTGSVLFWDPDPLAQNLFSANFTVAESCWGSSESRGNRKRDYGYIYEAYLEHGSPANRRQVHPVWSTSLSSSSLDKRVPFLITPITGYYNLENPGILSPAYRSYNPRPIDLGLTGTGTLRMTTTGKAIVYAREHVYEESLAAQFVDYLEQSTELWQNAAGTANWCNWVSENLQSSPAYFPAPSVANVAKNLAMYNTERQLNQLTRIKPLRDPDEFMPKCPTAQVSVYVASRRERCHYMNAVPIRQLFLTGNTCIRNVWDTWQQVYRAAANVDAPDRANVEVTDLYDSWIHDIVAGMAPWLKDEIQNLIRLVVPDPSTISLSFNVLLDNQALTNPQGTPIGQNAPYTTNFQGISIGK
ncbi:hypothetical protein B0H10DRAFT_2440958 [Mycena sp. CBHHK59/15]|nr:hypothetical protein B0H10DRAFT_2440958 [Mycena sp. CBHHK59/15]